MSLIKSLMGRRQFLIAAGMTSTAALASNKFSGLVSLSGMVETPRL